MSAARVKPGELLAGKYRVERVLGEGGMGVVVAAFHIALEKRVAVKFLRKDMADRGDAAERFRREARAVANIQSEHVARVLDVGTMEDGETYIVMEYLDGNDLAAEMNRRGALPLAECVDIGLQIADAVSEAHASGIVHRDLKPANVFLVRRADGSRLAKVLDFGISKSLLADSASNVSLTQTSTVMGSPLYMSPEQMRSARDVDTRTDIWALGAILYEAFAGAPPHSGTSLPEICTSLLHDTPRSIESTRGDMPPGLSAVIMRCLAKDRADRWPTMRDLMMALAPYAPETSGFLKASTVVSGLAAYGTRTTGSGASRAPTPIPPMQPVPSPRTDRTSTEAPASLTLSSETDLRAARHARAAIFVGLFGAAIVVAALAFFAFRFTGRGEEVAKGIPEAPRVGAAAQGVTAPETPAVTAVTASGVAAVPVTETIAAPAKSASAEKGALVESASAAMSRPKPHVVVERPIPKRPGAQAESITDFGGRR
jgi:serine/threonine-protein kinase